MESFKKCPKHISWMWIKEKSKTDQNASSLVELAFNAGCEPHRLAGIPKIREWLFDLEVSADYFDFLRILETQYHNIKFFAQEGCLNSIGDV